MIEQNAPKFQEEYSSKIPALTLLANLGWEFLSPEQAQEARGGKQDEVILKDVLREELRKQQFLHAGKEQPLSEKAIDKLIGEIIPPRRILGFSARCYRISLKA